MAVYTVLHNAFVALKLFNATVVVSDVRVRTQNTTKNRREKIKLTQGLVILYGSNWISSDFWNVYLIYFVGRVAQSV